MPCKNDNIILFADDILLIWLNPPKCIAVYHFSQVHFITAAPLNGNRTSDAFNTFRDEDEATQVFSKDFPKPFVFLPVTNF